MAVRLNVNLLSRIARRGEVSFKVSLKGITFTSTTRQIKGDEIVFDESFYWTLEDSSYVNECIQFQVFLHNRYLTKSLIGLYFMPLHEIETQKYLIVNDVLCNQDNLSLSIGIKFEVSYVSPESGPLEVAPINDDKILEIPLVSEVPEMTKRSRSISLRSLKSTTQLKRRAITFTSTAVKSIGKSIGLSKKSVDQPLLVDVTSDDDIQQTSTISSSRGDSASVASGSVASLSTPTETVNDVIVDIEKLSNIMESEVNEDPIFTPVLVKQLSEVREMIAAQPKPEFYQVGITVIEAQELPGTNLNPFVVVQIDDQKKQTTVKESTSTPYYNEYFAYDFNLIPNLLFDKIITITVYHSRNILRSDKIIGTFKLDIGSIFHQPDHQFYHKWAVLTNSEDLHSPIKGFLKCDIAVIGKGYNVLTSSARDTEDDEEQNIIDNLMLPRAVSAERPVAKYTITIYRADGLPRYSSGFLTSVKKKLSSLKKQLVNPYVAVYFAGLKAKTSVIKHCRSPIWNEKIDFYELFPPLFQRIKIEIRDSQTGNDSRICTHYLSLSSISNAGEEGFLPTFGPSFLHFYGSMLGFDESGAPKEDDEVGVCYRGRLLLSISTEILESNEQIPKGQVNVEPTPVINEALYGKVRDFLAFVTIYDSTQIPKKYGEKKISYEISVGNPALTSHLLPENPDEDSVDEKHLEDIADDDQSQSSKFEESIDENMKNSQPRTSAYKSVSSGKNSYYLPFEEVKPCIYLTTSWPDNRRRVYSANILSQIIDNLELGILDVEEMIKMEREGVERRMSGVYEEFLFGCNRYLSLTLGSGGSAGGKTKLDKERIRIIQRGIEKISRDITGPNLKVTKQNLKDKLRLAKFYLSRIREIADDPQHGIPDIFIWMIVGGKKVAYSRLMAKNYLFSITKYDSGKNCGKVHSIYFQVPGKPSYDVVNKLSVYVWYGLMEHKQHFTKGLIRGYENIDELSYADNISIPPPKKIVYTERHIFKLRVHLYQARSLIPSDDSGLSDPYAKVYFLKQCLQTQVINETLSPIWNEMLVFDDINIYGERRDLFDNLPSIVVEIFDEDKRGTDDFLGRSVATPLIRFADQPYSVPKLSWFDLWRGREEAGQILAAFELIQLSDNDDDSCYPKMLPVTLRSMSGTQKQLYSVPNEIRPTLSSYKMEIFFWGLRDMKKLQFSSVDRPRVDVDCCGHTLSSTTISHFKKNPNFSDPLASIDLKLPDQDIYCPPITIRVVDCKAFGRTVLIGSHTIKSILKYIHRQGNKSPTTEVMENKEINLNPKIYFAPEIKAPEKSAKKPVEGQKPAKPEENEEETLDWWSRYYASKESSSRRSNSMSSDKVPSHLHFRIYSCELENASDFQKGYDLLQLFELTRGKKNPNDEEDVNRCVGLFRGAICLYKLPLLVPSVFDIMPQNEPMKLLVRVYIVKATDLCPTDMGGKADPYVVLTLGNKKVSDKENYVPNQLNPVFGKCFEFNATFPQDCFLTVQIKDHDLIGSNEMIGETRIDLEQRFYSFYRFCCGLPKVYETKGPNKWRDSIKPSHILGQMCKFMRTTHYFEKNKVKVGNIVFTFNDPDEDKKNVVNEPRKQQKLVKMKIEEKTEGQVKTDDQAEEKALDIEQMSLAVLNNFEKAIALPLCLEHVETRALYHPEKPGVERGQIEMWIDMFPSDLPQPPPATDITPRKPISYELRVIIWNTDEVVLQETNVLTGEKMSDIYVKGWLTDSNEQQSTDVHYRSLTGEGNFNWRFIFPFDYSPSDEKIIITKKESIFSWDETETKIPPKLYLQVWDADMCSSDDFLGALTLDLTHFVRGGKTSLSCTLDMATKTGDFPKMSIFTNKRVKGWWPFIDKNEEGETILTGKVEAEFHLLTKEEAEASPAGLGRSEPDPLDKPNRPETSFMWFMNPFKTLKYVIWRNFKSKIIKGLIFLFLILFFALFIYSAPGLTAQKIIGAI